MGKKVNEKYESPDNYHNNGKGNKNNNTFNRHNHNLDDADETRSLGLQAKRTTTELTECSSNTNASRENSRKSQALCFFLFVCV